MAKGEDFVKKGKCGHNYCSAMSNSAWCDLNSKCDNSKLHDRCAKCNSQKLISFTPRQYMLEGAGFKNTMKKIFKGSQTTCNKLPKPAVNVAAPFIGMAVGAKTKNPKVAAATTNILKSITGGKTLSLTDMHGRGLRLKVM